MDGTLTSFPPLPDNNNPCVCVLQWKMTMIMFAGETVRGGAAAAPAPSTHVVALFQRYGVVLHSEGCIYRLCVCVRVSPAMLSPATGEGTGVRGLMMSGDAKLT